MSREQEAKIIADSAAVIGTNPAWLDALINFETGGTYDPMASNPRSSAMGLIQLIDASAKDLGYADSTQAVTTFPDFESQMKGIVIPYFKMKAQQNNINSYMTKQALYMAVFYPAYWNKPPNTEFPENVKAVNPGINTPQDYINFVDARIKKEELRVSPRLPILLALAGIGILAYYLWDRYVR